MAIAIACLTIGYWGVFTSSGSKRFDEMDGILPIASGALGILLLSISIGWA